MPVRKIALVAVSVEEVNAETETATVAAASAPNVRFEVPLQDIREFINDGAADGEASGEDARAAHGD
jgi:hypothetical protein